MSNPVIGFYFEDGRLVRTDEKGIRLVEAGQSIDLLGQENIALYHDPSIRRIKVDFFNTTTGLLEICFAPNNSRIQIPIIEGKYLSSREVYTLRMLMIRKYAEVFAPDKLKIAVRHGEQGEIEIEYFPHTAGELVVSYTAGNPRIRPS